MCLWSVIEAGAIFIFLFLKKYIVNKHNEV